MKYKEELYIDSCFYEDDRDGCYRNHKEKVVKCRKPHKCSGCGKEIQIGEKAHYESCIDDDAGFLSCYTCLPCIEEWVESIHEDEYLESMRNE